MIYGYARVSTAEQNTDSQRDALNSVGCEEIITDKVSGAAEKRPRLETLLKRLKKGDTLIVSRLDRLGRSLSHLIEIMNRLECQGVAFKSLSESIDTSTAGGRLIFHMMGALAEFERSLITERTQAGLQAAKSRGVRLGRPRSLTASQIKHAAKLIDNGENMANVAHSFGIDRTTLWRALSRAPKPNTT